MTEAELLEKWESRVTIKGLAKETGLSVQTLRVRLHRLRKAKK